MLPLGMFGKMLGKSAGKLPADNPYWDWLYTLKHSPTIAKHVAKKAHKAYTHVRDTPKPWHPTEYGQYKAAKFITDDRFPKPAPVIDAKEGAQELAKDHGVCRDYLEYLISHLRDKQSIKLVQKYVQSEAAKNLSPYDRTDLIIMASEKLKYLDVIVQFFH